jgi:hypothetical protein
LFGRGQAERLEKEKTAALFTIDLEASSDNFVAFFIEKDARYHAVKLSRTAKSVMLV